MSAQHPIRRPRFAQHTTSIPTATPEQTGPRPLLADWPLLVGLLVLWLCLWGSLSPLTIVTGIVAAIAVVRVFELPHVILPGRLRPLWAAWYGCCFAVDLVLGSVQVAWQAVRSLGPAGSPRAALVAVPLAVRNDLLLTLVAVSLSLVPGSIVVEVDRGNAVLYAHVLGASTPEAVRRFREQVLRLERRLVLAIGSADDVAAVR